MALAKSLRMFVLIVSMLGLTAAVRVEHNDEQDTQQGIKYISEVAVYAHHVTQSSARRTFLEGLVSDISADEELWLIQLADVGVEQLEEVCAKAHCIDHGTVSPWIEVRSAEAQLATVLEALKREVTVKSVEPVIPIEMDAAAEEWVEEAAGAEKGVQSNWGLCDINQGTGSGGAGVRVYVLDTGIRTTHEQFAGGRALPGAEITINAAGTGEVKECSGAPGEDCSSDHNSHGTHCAGTVAGRTLGVAPDATVVAVEVFVEDWKNPDTPSNPSNALLKMLEWIYTTHTRLSPRVPGAVSMSVSMGGNSAAVSAVIDMMVEEGIVMVGAAGNHGRDACQTFPGGYPQVISVGAINLTGNPMYRDAKFSTNWGSCVDIMAPGVGVWSASNTDDSSRMTKTGTSMATPHVAGAVALLLSKNPSMTPAAVKQKLLETGARGQISGDLKGSPNLKLDVQSFVPEVSWQDKVGPRKECLLWGAAKKFHLAKAEAAKAAAWAKQQAEKVKAAKDKAAAKAAAWAKQQAEKVKAAAKKVFSMRRRSRRWWR